jgi:hypothetical protein
VIEVKPAGLRQTVRRGDCDIYFARHKFMLLDFLGEPKLSNTAGHSERRMSTRNSSSDAGTDRHCPGVDLIDNGGHGQNQNRTCKRLRVEVFPERAATIKAMQLCWANENHESDTSRDK